MHLFQHTLLQMICGTTHSKFDKGPHPDRAHNFSISVFLRGGVQGLLVPAMPFRSSCPFLWFSCILPAVVETTPSMPVPRFCHKECSYRSR